MKRIWNNKHYIATEAARITGWIYAFAGFIGMLAPLDELLPKTISMGLRVFVSLVIFIGVWIICFIGFSVYFLIKKRVTVFSVNNGHALYLQYGNIFNSKEIVKNNKQRNIVIPVNCCFDTHLNDQIVSEQTLHGMVLKKLYSSGLYTEESLSKLIETQLSKTEYDNLSDCDRPNRKLKRYPIGTIVDLPGVGDEHYFLYALSIFDKNMNAQTTMENYALAVQRLIEACNSESEGFPIVLPLIGTGLSRTKKNECDVLRYLISAFRLNKDEINSDIHIVVRDDLKDNIPILDIT